MDTDENNFETRVKDETEKLKEDREAELSKVLLSVWNRWREAYF